MRQAPGFICVFAALCGVALLAQDNRATLGGRVVDQQDALIPGATGGVVLQIVDPPKALSYC